MANIPSWESLHPLIIHFPIALLLVAPLFLLIGALRRPDQGRCFAVTAMILMVLGTAGAWASVATGEASAASTAGNSALKTTVEQHEDLADTTQGVFTVLTLVYAVILLMPLVQHQSRRLWTTVLPLVFLVFYVAGAILLARTAQEGGRLVHELGSSVPMIAEADN